MNLIDLHVTSIDGEPEMREFNGKVYWFVNVSAYSYGAKSPHTLMFKTEDEAKAVKVGYKFQE